MMTSKRLFVFRYVTQFLLLAGAAASANALEPVDIPSGNIPLRALVVRPPGPGPFPVVVALHGCGGLAGRRGMVEPRLRDWTERLVAAGIAVVLPDSFASRGVGQQCTTRSRLARASVERVDDVQAVRRWLLDQTWVRPDRLFLAGWSNGGSTTLWAVRPGAAVNDGRPDFRAAVAFYPGCRAPARRGWQSRIPLLLLIGEADDWTPASECAVMVKAARDRSAPIEYVAYPGAFHNFDHPNLPLRQRKGLAFTADGSGVARSGSDPGARADAIKRVLAWLGR